MSGSEPHQGNPDCFNSVKDGTQVEVRIKGSRCRGQVFRADGENQAAERLSQQRKQTYDATHHCSALRLSPPESPLERSDDDGEPSGTAGPPILGAIQRADLYDLLVVVTRYYGGTKLGTGGLVRAYAEAAREAIDVAPRRKVWIERTLEVRCDYTDIGAVEAVLARAGEMVHKTERIFEPDPLVVITVRRSHTKALSGAITEATAGRARVEVRPKAEEEL